MKRLLTSTAMLLCSLLTFAQFSGTVTDSQGVEYTANNDESTCYVSGHENTYNSEIVIPETYQGRIVTSIGMRAFYRCTGLLSVTIPNSVTMIDLQAFDGCTGLTSLTIPNSVTMIECPAFANCSGLTSIVVDSGNTVYDSRDNCNAIIETATNILISGCQNTVIPSTVTRIGFSAFMGCSSLTSITIPNSVTSIDGSAFAGCSGLTSVTIPNSVWFISGKAFLDCSGLTSVTIPNSVEQIFEGAFYGCNSLTSITIPNSVTSIDCTAFGGCSGLTSIVVESGNAVYDSRDNCNAIIETATNTLICGCQNTAIPNSVTSIGARAFQHCSSLTSITIPNSVISIGFSAFASCSDLSSITIPNSVTSIGESAFYCCKGLTSVEIPNSVTSIGDGTFQVCTGLTSVIIPNSVTSIGAYAFRDCIGLTSVTIPNSVTSIGNFAFYNCGSLTDVISEIQNPFTIAENVFEGVYTNARLTVPDGTKSNYQAMNYWNKFALIKEASEQVEQFSGTVTDSQGVKYTADNNGVSCYVSGHEDVYSSEIIIPETYQGRVVTKINNNTFFGCGSLSTITIPNSVTSIGISAFGGCSSLTSLTIPNSVTSIGTYAFQNCTGLTSVEIPSSVTSIGYGVFQGCSGLTSIVVESGNTVYDSRDNCNAIIKTATNTLISGCQNTAIPNSVTSIGGRAFHSCSSLTSITIPSSVTNIDGYAFCQTGLTSITIPNSVTSIGEGAFWHCGSLTSITIPNSVTTIGDYAFYNCGSLTDVISEIQNPFTIAENVFEGVYTKARLTVPDGTKSNYQATNYWNKFALIVEASEQIEQFSGTVSDSQGLIYTADNNGVSCYVSGFENNCSSVIVIPEVLQGRVVTGIAIAYWYDGLTSATIPSSVTSISDFSFRSSSLTEINVDANNPAYHSESGILFNKSKTRLVRYPAGKTDSQYTIPNSVTSIGHFAFCGCSNLTSITIPNSVTNIGYWAFSNCTSLPSITIPNSVTLISYGAFNTCSSLTSITIPNSVESIGERAFEDCSGLIDVISEIQSPFEIAENVFEGVYTKAKLTVPVGTIEKYQATNYWNKFTNIVEKDLPPVDDGETVDFSDDIDEDTDLDGNVVGNIYFNISSDDGGYNSAEGCIMVNKPTDDSSVDGQDIFGEDFHDNFTGIVFKVPAGSGTVKVEAQTTGSMVLKVKIGNNEPVSMELDGKLKASFPYNVTEPTFVYIYAGSNGSSAPGLFGNSANNGELKIYGIEVDNYIKGDVNGDGVVDVSDYIGVANHILGNTPVGFDTYAADVNNDGVIDVSDYIGIANIILTGSIYGNSNNAAPAFEEDAELDPQ